MHILDLLRVDKCLCITSFKEERFQNMIRLKKELGISIDFIEPIRDPNPSISYSKTFLHTIRSCRGKYNRVLMFEDDVWTDLTRDEMRFSIIQAGIPSLEYNVLSLGSQSYTREEHNPYLYKSKAYGYMHAVCFNLETLSDEFFAEVERLTLGESPINIDCAVSQALRLTDAVYVIKDSLFLQKNFVSGINPHSMNSKLDFRHTRNQDVSTGILVIKSKTPNTHMDYLDLFGTFYTDSLKLSFIGIPAGEVMQMRISDYHSGMYLYLAENVFNSYWISFRCPADKIVLELIKENRVCHREVIDLLQIQLS